MNKIREQLFALQDVAYGDFHSRLMPGIPREKIIGVRVPELRKLAKVLGKKEAADFLQTLPHPYYEEMNLHGILIAQLRDYEECVAALEAFLPYVDNWATCDLVSPKVLGKHKERLLADIQRWMSSEHPYTVRFGMEMLMRHYLDEAFQPEYLEWVAAVQSEEYYVRMMVAWYFATALSKQYEAAVVYLEARRLEPWVHNKTIQKAVESYRVPAERKAYLRTLRRSYRRSHYDACNL